LRGNSSNFFLNGPIKISSNYKIGILGGIGPEATGEFYNKLIKRLQERGLVKSNRDYPHIIINSIPAPELIYDKISDEDLKPYIKGLKELDNFGVDFIVIVCNTIHLFYDKLQKEVKTPILNLREELMELLIKKNIKSVFIIGTPSTIKEGLYEFEGIKTYNPDEEEIKFLADTIFRFNNGIDKEKQKVRDICNKYLGNGAETTILGCTEFGVMLDDEKIPKINTIDVMVDSVINKLFPHSA